ncbi:MAG: amidohydrolase [Bryobacteraceae bacterium]|nr:amidohydrolase family protein [Bryobacterales bacterium]NUN01226.1 amidohydrolase [Bryobacteraceae bacterium]
MTRRHLLLTGAAGLVPATPAAAPVVNAAEHAWVINDPRFPMRPELATCPKNLARHDYSAEFLLDQIRLYRHDHVVISHVCYYGRDNSYTVHCVKTYPGKFSGYGLLVGYRLYSPGDKENPSRLRRLIKDDGLIGLRLSPIYDPDVVWLNDPVCYPLWKTAEELGAVFHIFLAPHQVKQAGDMAERFPGVTVVIDHIAMIDIAAPDSDGFGPLLELAKFPNVYIRTSLHNPSKTKVMPYRDVWPFLERLYQRYGGKRMVYANFFEYVIMKDLIPFFTAEDREWILGRTAMKIYRIRL